MIWSVVHLVIIPGHFGAFILPLRLYKTSDQYPPKPSEVYKKKFRRGIIAFQEVILWALFTENSYEINLQFFPFWSSWRIKFPKKNSYSWNFMFNSRKKNLLSKVNLTTWYYLMVGSRKCVSIFPELILQNISFCPY
jgi:hypothetical protein